MRGAFLPFLSALTLACAGTGVEVGVHAPVVPQEASQRPLRSPDKVTGGLDVPHESARAFIELLLEKDFSRANGLFSSEMASVLPTEGLREVWTVREQRGGPFGACAELERHPLRGRERVWFRCDQHHDATYVEVIVDPYKHISGLRLMDGLRPWTPPSYVDMSRFSDVQGEVGEPPLRGVLSVPHVPIGVSVVLVHGTGVQDEDATAGPLGTGNKMFRDLGQGLASQGIHVLRYPKRTFAYPEQFESKAFTLDQEVISDACAAVSILAERFPSNRIVLVGHSLGASLLPRISAMCGDAAGWVLLAGPSRSLDLVIAGQLAYLQQLARRDKLQAALEISELLEGYVHVDVPGPLDEELSFLGMRAPRAYWLDILHYDPLVQLSSSREVPMLVLQGGRDYQVTLRDFDGWKRGLRGRTQVRFKFYPDLDHRFVAGVGAPSPADYDRSDHMSPAVVSDIVDWVKSRIVPDR